MGAARNEYRRRAEEWLLDGFCDVWAFIDVHGSGKGIRGAFHLAPGLYHCALRKTRYYYPR